MLARLKQALAPATRPLTLGGLALPREAETLHWLLAGTTGAGKSTAIAEMLDGITARGERCIVCDPNGGYLAQFGRPGDRLLNPFDARSERWGIFSELRRDFDADRLARSLVPDGHGDSAAWSGYAQVLAAEILRALARQGESRTERLLHYASVAPVAELAELLTGTPAMGLLDPDAAKTLASARFILTSHLAPQRYLGDGDFSLRRWLEQENGSLFLTWRADMQTALAPLLGCWVDVLINAVLSLPPDPGRRLWLVVDELAALGKLSSLEQGLTLGRKHGLAILAGLQSTAQLDRLYGGASAVVLRSCFRNLMVLAIAKTDPETCDTLSRALGEREVRRSEESQAQGSHGSSHSTHARQVQERVVLASEIASLPDLQGYLALAGAAPIQRVTLTPRQRPRAMAGYAEIDG